MKIEAINIQKFKAIDSYKGAIGGKNVYLIGGNGKGKTSFIDAVFKGLSGKNLPPEPITNGGKRGLIEIDLGDFIARTKFKAGRPTDFELENKFFTEESDKFIRSPRSYMEQRIGVLDFDINDFLNLSDAKQVEYVAKNLAVDFSDIDAEIEELMESRKFDKKRLAEAKTRQVFYKQEDALKEYVDTVAISKELEDNAKKAVTYDKVREGIATKKAQIEDAKKQIELLTAQIELRESEIKKGEDWLLLPVNLPMSAEVLDEKTKSRDTSATQNEVIKEAKEGLVTDKIIEELEDAIEVATDEIKAQKELKAEKLAEAITLKDLTYDVDKEAFMYQGRPFDKTQTNTAAQLIIGLRIASMMLKELRILRVDASLIDEVEFSKVLDWSKENDIELFVELVDRSATQLQIKVDE